MQYWINQNGVQSGPVTREELEKMDVSADAYVWRSGLDDWVKITTLPELEGVIGNAAPAEEKAAPAEEAPAIPAEESAPIIIPDLPQPDEQPALSRRILELESVLPALGDALKKTGAELQEIEMEFLLSGVAIDPRKVADEASKEVVGAEESYTFTRQTPGEPVIAVYSE